MLKNISIHVINIEQLFSAEVATIKLCSRWKDAVTLPLESYCQIMAAFTI
jgi:hypothetical protein